MNAIYQNIKYPRYDFRPTLLERMALKVRKFPMHCNICGAWTVAEIISDNFREESRCRVCHASNRKRQIAHILCNSLHSGIVPSLKKFIQQDISVYNTESNGPLHDHLSKMRHYACSEYLGENYSSGELVNHVMHQDLMNLSFEDESFDLVISSDVFEHLPDAYAAHAEVRRILKKGGRHVFTVPFYQTSYQDEIRASTGSDGKIIHHMEPLYHIDPLRPEGILVYTIFSIEMLVKLSRIGFRTNLYHLYIPRHGILGRNDVIFEAIKE
jgi:SAM-dependent methyltransferase